MKKLAFFIIVMISLSISSCDKVEDVTVGFETAIKANMPVVSVKTGAEEYTFTGGGLFSLSSDQEIRKHLENLQSLAPLDGSLIQFSGAKQGNKVLFINMKYGIQNNPNEEPTMISAFNFFGQLGESNGTIDYQNDSWSPNLIKAFSENKDKVFVIKIEGKANYNVSLPVKLDVPVKVNTTPLQ